MHSRRTKVALRRPLAVLAGVLLTPVILGAVVLNVGVDTEAVREWLAPRASATLNRPVTVGSVRVGIFPHPSIQVADVRVDNLPGFDGPALASVERLRLDVATLPLLIGRVRVRRLVLEGSRLNLAVDERGTTNFGDLAPDWTGTPAVPASPVTLDLRRIVVSDASVSYFDSQTSRSFTVSGADVDVSLVPDEATGWRAEVTTAADSLRVLVASLTPEIIRASGPSAALTLAGDPAGGSMDITRGSVELAGHEMTVHGRVAGLAGAHPTYDLQLTNQALDADVLTLAFPARRRSELMPGFDGVLAVTFQVAGARASGEGPVVRGSIRLDDVAVHLSGGLMADHVRGIVGVAPDTIVFDSLSGMFAEGPFAASGVVSRGDRTFSVTANVRPDLDALDRLGLLPEGATLSGNAAVDLSLEGRLDALDSLATAGTVTLAGAQAKLSRLGVPIYVPTGSFAFADHETWWSDLTVLVGEDPVRTSGRVAQAVSSEGGRPGTPRFDVSIRGARLDLGALLPPREDAVGVGYPLVAVSHLGGRTVEGRTPAAVVAGWGMSRPVRVPAVGNLALELDTLRFRGRLIESLVATVEVSDSSIFVDAPELAIWGGSASGSLRLGVGPAPEESFSLVLRTAGASGEQLMPALTPVGDAIISGSMSLDAEIDGVTDRSLLPIGRDLSGQILLSATDGSVQGTGPNLAVADFLGSQEWIDFPFSTWDTHIAVEDGHLEVRSSDLSGPLGRVALAGVLDYDGSHDLAVGVSIPPEHLDSVSLRRTGIGQNVLDHLKASGSPLDLGLRMRGVLWAPSLEPDASSALASAR